MSNKGTARARRTKVVSTTAIGHEPYLHIECGGKRKAHVAETLHVDGGVSPDLEAMAPTELEPIRLHYHKATSHD